MLKYKQSTHKVWPVAILLQALISLYPATLLADEATQKNSTPSTAETKESHNTEIARPAIDQKKDSPVTALPEVKVKSSRIKDTSINPTQSITTITSKDLERIQPANIFEAVKSVPGVSINGGPRPSGMSFSIRGYSDNEDVMVKVDGVPKGFEKYRMGGTFVEPELLKSIEVQRGPQISSGSGSLGGTIIATTKDAADLLEPGKRYGAKLKFGYANNNDEYSRSYLLYGRPDDRIDILYNYSNRQSNNITRADGTPLLSSAIESISQLLKFSIFPIESIKLTTSVVSFKDTGLQPYDSTGGQPGSFGNVIRAIDDLTWSETLNFTPDTNWINLKATYGRGHTDLHDLIRPDMGSSLNPPGLGKGNLNDYYSYETESADITNTSKIFEGDWFNASVLLGYQFNKSKREVERYFDDVAYSQALYPNGFNASAPPGTKTYEAFYIQPRFELGALSIIPGYRRDWYEVEASGGTLALLAPYNQSNQVKFQHESVNLGLAYELMPKLAKQKLTIFSNYGQGFRPPLIDEYFTQGAFGRCNNIPIIIPGFSMPNGPASSICGDLYQLQTSESTEAGISYQNPRLLDTDAQLTSKINFFHIHTSHLLNSLQEVPSGQIVQDGWERRNGVEFESTFAYKAFYARGAYSRTTGKLFNGKDFVPLYTVPGNALNLVVGAQATPTIDVNIGYRKISERSVVLSGGSFGQPFVFGSQDGYELWNAGIHWAPTKNIGFRILGENITNKEYRLDGGFGGSIGTFAPGRNIRFITELTY